MLQRNTIADRTGQDRTGLAIPLNSVCAYSLTSLSGCLWLALNSDFAKGLSSLSALLKHSTANCALFSYKTVYIRDG